MIGGNDFCSDMCYLSEPSFVIENHESNLTMALRIIRDNLPRTFVSLIPPPHIKALYFAIGRTPFCDLILDFECPCVFGSRWDQQRSEFFDIMTKFVKNFFIHFCRFYLLFLILETSIYIFEFIFISSLVLISFLVIQMSSKRTRNCKISRVSTK